MGPLLMGPSYPLKQNRLSLLRQDCAIIFSSKTFQMPKRGIFQNYNTEFNIFLQRGNEIYLLRKYKQSHRIIKGLNTISIR